MHVTRVCYLRVRAVCLSVVSESGQMEREVGTPADTS